MTALTPGQIAGYAKAAGFTGANLALAVAVALAESDGRTDAVNVNTDTHRSRDLGVWQINDYWNADVLAKFGNQWQDPAVNARMAYMEWSQHGWRDWSTFKSGAYLKHMAAGNAAAGNPATVTGTGAAAFGTSGTGTGGLVGTALGTVANPFSAFTNSAIWIRAGEVIAGGALVLGGLAILGFGQPGVQKAVKSAVKVAEVVK